MTASDLAIGLGLLLIVEGLPLFLVPDRYRRLLRQIELVSDGTLRIFGLVAMCAGLMVLYGLR